MRNPTWSTIQLASWTAVFLDWESVKFGEKQSTCMVPMTNSQKDFNSKMLILKYDLTTYATKWKKLSLMS